MEDTITIPEGLSTAELVVWLKTDDGNKYALQLLEENGEDVPAYYYALFNMIHAVAEEELKNS